MLGSIIGGLIGQGGANANAAAVGEAAARANQIAENQHNENRSDIGPWRNTGVSALSTIGKLLGWGNLEGKPGVGETLQFTGDPSGEMQKSAFNAFKTSPGYEFRLGEGIKALDRSASAKGRLMSGAQMKGVQSFGEGLAADEYGSYFNNLMSLAGLGQQGASTLVGANTGLAGQSASNTLNAGIARGSAYQSGANALASGIGNGINNVIGGTYLFRNKLGLG